MIIKVRAQLKTEICALKTNSTYGSSDSALEGSHILKELMLDLRVRIWVDVIYAGKEGF